MVKRNIRVAVPDEYCDECSYIKYIGDDGVCQIFFTELNKNDDDCFIPCNKCIGD